MIKEKTLFILGAGASLPYKFPLGSDLKKFICSDKFGSSFIACLKKEKHELMNTNKQQVEYNINVLRKKLKLVPKKTTIDYFLSNHPDQRYQGIQAILFSILYYERNSRFNYDSDENEGDWYSHLIDNMMKDLGEKNPIDNIGKNNIEFITFNYDRSLEYYLFNGLNSSFEQATYENIKEQLNKIKIDHVYGKLGELPELQNNQNNLSLSYGDDISYSDIHNYMPNIKIIEVLDKQKNFKKIIEDHKRIFILGFGFEETNIKNIGLFEGIDESHKIYATCKYEPVNKIN